MTNPIVASAKGFRYRRTGKTGKFSHVLMEYMKNVDPSKHHADDDPAFVGLRLKNVWTLTEMTQRSAMQKAGLQYLDGWSEDGDVELVHPLPRVPGWPLPGPPPQYLRQLHGEDRHFSGDVWLIIVDADGDGKLDEIWSNASIHEREKWNGLPAHRYFRMHGNLSVPETGPIPNAYLIAKADFEADA